MTTSDSLPDFRIAMRIVMMPRDTNIYGTIFGGIILSYIDQAGYIEARTHGIHRWVTASLDRVDFVAPVEVGDVVILSTRTIRKGTSSITVAVQVDAKRYATNKLVRVTEATISMIAVDAEGKPIPFDSPPTLTAPGL